MAPTLFTRMDMDRPEEHALAGGLVGVWSARSPGKDTDNEDGAALVPVDPDRGVLVVADGLGGHAEGAEAARLGLESLAERVERTPDEPDASLRSAILDGFEGANRCVSDLGSGAATTLAAVEIDGEIVRPYHVGDSMILVVGQRGKLKLRTVSHSPVGYGEAAGLLDAREAIHHEERHIVSNIVGCQTMRIEVGPTLVLARRDTVVLATDGLFDNLHIEEIVEHVRKGTLRRAVRELVDHARERMLHPEENEPSKPDDLTVLVYRRAS